MQLAEYVQFGQLPASLSKAARAAEKSSRTKKARRDGGLVDLVAGARIGRCNTKAIVEI